jgi:hypothetical protein
MNPSYGRLRPLSLILLILSAGCATPLPSTPVAQVCPKLPAPPYALPTPELQSWLGWPATWQMLVADQRKLLETAPSGSKP